MSDHEERPLLSGEAPEPPARVSHMTSCLSSPTDPKRLLCLKCHATSCKEQANLALRLRSLTKAAESEKVKHDGDAVGRGRNSPQRRRCGVGRSSGHPRSAAGNTRGAGLMDSSYPSLDVRHEDTAAAGGVAEPIRTPAPTHSSPDRQGCPPPPRPLPSPALWIHPRPEHLRSLLPDPKTNASLPPLP